MPARPAESNQFAAPSVPAWSPGRAARAAEVPMQTKCRTGRAFGLGPFVLDDALVEHRVGDLHETGDVRAEHVIALTPVLLGGHPTLPVDRLHDVFQPAVDLLALPGEAQGILRHLEPGDRDATRV